MILRGDNGISIASSLNYYLKKYCHAHFSWTGDQLNLPKPLPSFPRKIKVVKPNEYVVYFNYCTMSYTAAWWDWKRWEREIDFMALNGINAPLFITGLEGVWYHTLRKYQFSDKEARDFLVGPAYFAWQWMANIEGQGGPLPKDWIDSSVKLGQQIVARQRELGMTPIQQGFSGHVPKALKKKYPDARIKLKKRWCDLAPTAQLDPTDPFFKKFGKTFLEEQKKLFGTSHLYAADPFHESKPPVKGKEYLNKTGKTISKVLSSFDKKAIWVMQSWSLREDIVKAVSKKKLLIVDLAGRRWKKDGFWGYKFVVGQLHNFGGRINLHGSLEKLGKNQFSLAKKQYPKNYAGMGLFMEAIDQNPVYYDLFFELVYNKSIGINVGEWLERYADRRYGKELMATKGAWAKYLLYGPYHLGTDGVEKSSIIAARPALIVKKSGPNAGFKIPYLSSNLLKGLDLLISEYEKLKEVDPYRYDIVDLLRQSLSNLGQAYYQDVVEAYLKKDKNTFKKKKSKVPHTFKRCRCFTCDKKRIFIG